MGSSADSPPKEPSSYKMDCNGIVERAINNLRQAGRSVPIIEPIVR